MMRNAVLIGALGLAAALGGCYSTGYPVCYAVCAAPYPPAYPSAYTAFPTLWDDPFADYTQRIVTVSTTAGNAQAANTALQTATPWPRYSSNTNIPGNGARMVKAIQNYERGIVPPPPALGSTEGGGGGGGTASNNNAGGGESAGGGSSVTSASGGQ